MLDTGCWMLDAGVRCTIYKYKVYLTLKLGGEGLSEEYITLKARANDEYIVKHSRFIGYASPVSCSEEALEFIAEIRRRHYDATHNVYAYVLRNDNIRRYSDDGEPQGTAGLPVLDVLLKENIFDAALVVTRYFGGIMLGAGGLVRAYSHSAKIAVDAAVRVKMGLCSILEIICDYNFYSKLTIIINEFNAETLESVFAEDVKLTISLSIKDAENFQLKLIDSSGGKVNILKIGEKFAPLKII